MSTARISRKSKASNAAQLQPAGGGETEKQPANLVEQSAAVWAALAYLAKKQQRRDDLPGGKVFAVKLQISAKVDGGPLYQQAFDGPLAIGGDSNVAASHVPGGDKRLIALIMGKLNEQTRAAIFRDLPADYAACSGSEGDEAPAADAGIESAVDAMMKQLRAGKKTPRKGDVTYDGKPERPSLSLIG